MRAGRRAVRSRPGPGSNQRGKDVLAYFERPGTSNGPTEAINGRLEHLRGSALGFRNLTNYIARSPRVRQLETATTPSIVKSLFTVALAAPTICLVTCDGLQSREVAITHLGTRCTNAESK